mmetsp:Transcript_23296/g.46487  ORF Transcript_23296/g.46487 Transcript_23296/m.46487 type:complete len:221 (-) Transcript_23296:409-1071(-)
MRSPISDRAASKTEPRSPGVGGVDVNGEADGDPEGGRDGSGLGVGSCEVVGPIDGIKDNDLEGENDSDGLTDGVLDGMDEGSSETDGLFEGILLLVGAKEGLGHLPQLRGQKVNIFWFPRFLSNLLHLSFCAKNSQVFFALFSKRYPSSSSQVGGLIGERDGRFLSVGFGERDGSLFVVGFRVGGFGERDGFLFVVGFRVGLPLDEKKHGGEKQLPVSYP